MGLVFPVRHRISGQSIEEIDTFFEAVGETLIYTILSASIIAFAEHIG